MRWRGHWTVFIVVLLLGAFYECVYWVCGIGYCFILVGGFSERVAGGSLKYSIQLVEAIRR